jgi:hypothetical protein
MASFAADSPFTLGNTDLQSLFDDGVLSNGSGSQVLLAFYGGWRDDHAS